MAGSRNLPVHLYCKLHYDAVYRIIGKNLKDPRHFAEMAACLV